MVTRKRTFEREKAIQKQTYFMSHKNSSTTHLARAILSVLTGLGMFFLTARTTRAQNPSGCLGIGTRVSSSFCIDPPACTILVSSKSVHVGDTIFYELE